MNVSIVQTGPVYYNLSASMVKATQILNECHQHGADLVVFGETWLSGYPVWLDYCPESGFWDHPPVKKVWARMFENAVSIEGDEIAKFKELAANFKMNIVLGVNEKIISGKGNGSLYNSVITIDHLGLIRNHHRKLMPTYTERLVHGVGDGHGLKAIDMNIGRLGSLICWEHWMPLTRSAMHDEGEDIHIALWPNVREMHQIASRHYAFEGRCIVIAVGQIARVSDTPRELKLPDNLKNKPNHLIMNGGSSIIAPDGSYIMEPKYDYDGVIHTSLPEPRQFLGEKMNLSVSGHYQRHDVFNLVVNKKRNTED